MRFRNIDKNKLEGIAEYFYKHKKTEWVALTTGEWDLISGFLVNNINEFDDEVQTVLISYLIICRTKRLLQLFIWRINHISLYIKKSKMRFQK